MQHEIKGHEIRSQLQKLKNCEVSWKQSYEQEKSAKLAQIADVRDRIRDYDTRHKKS